MSPPSTSDKIIDAAMSIVRERGVAKLTLDEAAKTAGISKGGVLYHFKTKDDLIRGMVARLIEQCDTLHHAYYQEEPEGPYRWARTVVRTAFDPNGPVSDPISSAMLAAIAVNPELVAPLQAKFEEWTARVRSDSPDFHRASLVCMAMDGYVFHKMIGLDLYAADDLDCVKQTALDLLK